MQRLSSLTLRLGMVLAVAFFVAAVSGGVESERARGTGGASALFGDGSDGAITFSSSTQFNPPADGVVNSGMIGATQFTVSGVSGSLVAGQKIMIHQTRGLGAGSWELNSVAMFALGNVFTTAPLAYTYASGGADAAQVLVVPQYTNLTVDAGVTVSAKPWNGATGGILALLASGTAALQGTITADTSGFRGGQAIGSPNTPAFTGEGTAGSSIQCPCGAARENAGLGDAGFTGASGAGGGGGRKRQRWWSRLGRRRSAGALWGWHSRRA